MRLKYNLRMIALAALLAQIDWRADYAEALKEAKTTGKNVLVHLSTSW
jgi:hypothetical protein